MLNKYGELYREQIIRSTIRRSIPSIFNPVGFNVCPIDDASEVLGVFPRESDAYKLLQSFHCVYILRIPKEIRQHLPELIREALTPEHP